MDTFVLDLFSFLLNDKSLADFTNLFSLYNFRKKDQGILKFFP